jgi:hypothetical protein
MQNKVYEATKIKTTIARPGLNLELKLYPFWWRFIWIV